MASDRHSSGTRDVEDEVDRLAASLKRVLSGSAAQAVPMATGQDPVRTELVLRSIENVTGRLSVLERLLTEIHEIVLGQRLEKEWYTTKELAEILGKSHYTIQERWCNDGRIECEKDPDSGKWRIPGHEFRRLRAGGSLLPKKRHA